MKNFFRSFIGKGLLYATVLISSLVLGLSALGSVYMYFSDYYTQTEEYIQDSMITSLIRNTSADAFTMNFNSMSGVFEEKTTGDIGNFVSGSKMKRVMW